MKTKLLIIISFVLVFIVFIKPISSYSKNEDVDINAKVIYTQGIEEKEENGITKVVQKIIVKILEGEYKDEEYDTEYILTEDNNTINQKTELKENDRIIVNVEEEEGEVISVGINEVILQQNNMVYIFVLLIAITLLLLIMRKKIIKPLIIYSVILLLMIFAIIIAIKKDYNLIIISSIISVIITIIFSRKITGIKSNKIKSIICIILGVLISGISVYIIFDVLKLTDVMISVISKEKQISAKEAICAVTILIFTGVTNLIALSNCIIKDKTEYKKKSDNIIDGQRSLKI